MEYRVSTNRSSHRTFLFRRELHSEKDKTQEQLQPVSDIQCIGLSVIRKMKRKRKRQKMEERWNEEKVGED